MPTRLFFSAVLSELSVDTHLCALIRLGRDLASYMGNAESTICHELSQNVNNATMPAKQGVSITHVQSDVVKEQSLGLAVLRRPVRPKLSLDSQPVDIVCLLLSPEKDGPRHLTMLAGLSRVLKHQKLCDYIRNIGDTEMIRAVFADPKEYFIAA